MGPESARRPKFGTGHLWKILVQIQCAGGPECSSAQTSGQASHNNNVDPNSDDCFATPRHHQMLQVVTSQCTPAK